jgi:trimeric autotransporter adhesin
MGINTAAVQRLYVAYFNRPADTRGLAKFEAMLGDTPATKEDLAAISGSFSGSAEYKANFEGLDSLQIVNQLYLNIFGRAADLDGLVKFADDLDSGAHTVESLALHLSYAAQGTDATVVQARIDAAIEFTNGIDTAEEVLGYTGLEAAAQGRAYLAQISGELPTDDATITAQKDAAIAQR